MRIEIVRSDGGVSVMQIVDGTPEEAIAKWETGGRHTMVSWREVQLADIPPNRKFRNAWAPGLTVDMPKARIIHMDRIRAARDRTLAQADTNLARAQDDNDGPEQARLRTLRRTLRDLPQNFDLSGATTPEALDALWPAELPDRT